MWKRNIKRKDNKLLYRQLQIDYFYNTEENQKKKTTYTNTPHTHKMRKLLDAQMENRRGE